MCLGEVYELSKQIKNLDNSRKMQPKHANKFQRTKLMENKDMLKKIGLERKKKKKKICKQDFYFFSSVLKKYIN
jgi:hypothetical protein